MNFLKSPTLLTLVSLVSAQEVTLDNGVTVEGYYCEETYDQECYLGIPYAAAPIGNRRFRPPQDYVHESDYMEAWSHGYSCTQPFSSEDEGYGEDCLFLNVYAPAPEDRGDLPVMVWIHGGCYVFGASDEFSGNDLVSEGVIVVTINYRLGVFGFLGAEELRERDGTFGTTGNYGTLDSIQALKWVQENIASFGGNPDNVTIFG
jgi:para-nitrobenzyl esterase